MVTAYGGFSGQLDANSFSSRMLKSSSQPARWIHGKQFRVKISNLEVADQQGNVSAIVRGAARHT